MALKDGLIDNDTIWNNISSNNPKDPDGSNETQSVINLIIYANKNLKTASWKNIILKKDNFPNLPSIPSLSFDAENTEIHETFYGKVNSVEITGLESLSEIFLDCVLGMRNLDISNNGFSYIDFDNVLTNVRSITMKNMTLKSIILSEPTLEYLDLTNTTSGNLEIAKNKLKSLIGFTPNTLIPVEIDGEEKSPSLALSNFKMPINLDNFPSNMTIALLNNDYFPTGLDTIENITSLNISVCKNNNKIREFYIDNCNKINLSYILSLNRIKIDNIDKSGRIEMIGNIDLVTLELPKQDFSTVIFILYANINLSEIICDGISYGKEDDGNDLVALCRALKITLYETSNYNTYTKHRLGFNKLYIKEEMGYYNINPQIYKNRELIGNPLTNYDTINNILDYGYLYYYYIELPNPIGDIINSGNLPGILTRNVINYNDTNITITDVSSSAFVALGLNTDTAISLVDELNKDENENGTFVFTDKPNLLKGVKYYKVINPFTYVPDLPNVFGIKLVVY